MLSPDEHEPRWIRWIRSPRVRQSLTLIGLWAFLVAVLAHFRTALLPFGLALLLAFIVEPAVDWLAHQHFRGRRVPRPAAIIGIYIVSLSLLGVLGSWAASQVGRELAGLGRVSTAFVSETRRVTSDFLDQAEAFAEQNEIPIERGALKEAVEHNLIAAMEEAAQNVTSIVGIGRDVITGAFRTVFGMFLVLMLAAFMSIDKVRIKHFFFSMVPPYYSSAYTRVLEGMSIGLAGVVRGQVLICLVNGMLTFIGLWIFDIRLPLILASIAAVFSLIPIFGSILSTIPIVALALTDSVGRGVLALLWIIGIHLLEANLLNPKIMGDSAKIHPVIVVFALIVGEQSAGLPGALFAVPIASIIITIFKFLHHRALSVEAPVLQTDSDPEIDIDPP